MLRLLITVKGEREEGKSDPRDPSTRLDKKGKK
jgi:hypothetical protein